MEELNAKILELKQPYLKTITCLDKGFCRLVDFYGDDHRIVQAARVSYGQGAKSVREDKGLIDYLIRNEHTSPLEQVQFTFHERMPIFVARQLVRHRTAKLNEISGRYSVLVDDFYVPDINRLQKQSTDNKQGSSQELVNNPQNILNSMIDGQKQAYNQYKEYLADDLAKELARINLPGSIYTEWYWTCDAHNLFHLLKLRLDSHAQYEVRVYAQAKYDLIKNIIPWSCESFEEHIRGGKKISASEWKLIEDMLPNNYKELIAEAASQKLGWKERRINELLTKLG